MQPETLKAVIIDQQKMRSPSNFVERAAYKKARTLHGNAQIVIITGIRRCGKSTLLQKIREGIAQSDYYLNFDDDRLANFTVEDFQTLQEIFIELYGVQTTFYFDEIQNIPGWERFVRRLHDQNNKIYITGSNATMFSQELGTRLTGRYIKLEMYPFSFSEFANARHIKTPNMQALSTQDKGILQNLFAEFRQLGGIPEFVKHQQIDYLHSLYESILYRDIVARYKTNEHAMKELVFYLASNLGKEISYNKLAKMLGLSNASTVSNYCQYLENSFLCFLVSRYDVSLKKQLLHAKKVYCIDQALANTIGFRISPDMGRFLENIVFLELKRQGHEIYFHRAKKECDFLIKKSTHITQAIQVSTQMQDEHTKQRELAGLLEAMETYTLSEGYIITQHTKDTLRVTHKNNPYTIHVTPIWEWLLNSVT